MSFLLSNFTIGDHKFSPSEAIFNDGQVNKDGQNADAIFEALFEAIHDRT